MKIFDCFMYFDEDLVLEVRLNFLNKFVDKFVIIESEYNHKGEKRTPLFNINKFERFKNKIEYITLSGFGKNTPLNRNSKKNIFVNSKSFNIIEITHLYILIQIVDLIKGKLEYSNKI